jgi:hypothetical protein
MSVHAGMLQGSKVLNGGLNIESLELPACTVTLQNDVFPKELFIYGQAYVE